jgi:phage shock protein C
MTEDHQLQTNHHSAARRLYRSRNHRVFGGVAGGMAQYFHMDPVFMRVIFILVMALPGPGLLAYIICWIMIPLEPAE